MPHWWLLPGIIMSALASIIASQALISGSFTIFSEAINIDFWPRLRIKYPTSLKGQLYIPSVNLFLFAGCILTVLLFRTSANMEGAYGLAITMTMLVTTVLLAIWLRQRGTRRWIIYSFAGTFILIEGLFFCANLFKFMHGGWYTLLIAGIMTAIVIIWKRASHIRSKYFTYSRAHDNIPIVAGISTDRDIPKYASNLVYISRSPDPLMIESKILYSIINNSPNAPTTTFFCASNLPTAPTHWSTA